MHSSQKKMGGKPDSQQKLLGSVGGEKPDPPKKSGDGDTKSLKSKPYEKSPAAY